VDNHRDTEAQRWPADVRRARAFERLLAGAAFSPWLCASVVIRVAAPQKL
jgi:hypothetical protein